MKMLHHPFVNTDRAKQLISFGGLQWGRNNRPTDVDALFELRDKLYVIIEAKYVGNQMPFGQKLALTRLCDDLSVVKPALLILANHSTPVEEMVDLASAAVNEFRFKRKWWVPDKSYTVRELMDKFIANILNVGEASVDSKKI